MNIYELDGERFIYLFKLISKQANLDTLNFCAYENVRYQNETYVPIPCELTGYNVSTSGVIQPSLSIYSKVISPLIRQYNHLLNWEIHILKIKKSHLTIVNPLTSRPFDIFSISQKTNEIPGQVCTFKLRPRTNLKGQVGRQLGQLCNWVYRGDGCEYQGAAMYTADNQITNDPNLDICALTLTACKLRNNVSNFSGIPTINDYS